MMYFFAFHSAALLIAFLMETYGLPYRLTILCLYVIHCSGENSEVQYNIPKSTPQREFFEASSGNLRVTLWGPPK